MDRPRASRTQYILLITLLGIAGCSTQGPSAAIPSAGASVAPPSASALLAASPTASIALDRALLGEWVRVQSCEEQLASFEEAGLAESHVMWISGNWIGEEASPTPGKECEGARPPEEHSHFFTEDGRFGSRDAQGQQVDDGDYVLIDHDTLAFPSHAREFAYAGDLLVDFNVSEDRAEFRVQVPDGCEATCADAYAWALSAFFDAKNWERASR